jgi:pheromone shutdown protein TraB
MLLLMRLQQVRSQRPRPLLQPAARMPRVSSAPTMVVTPSELLELGLDCVGCVAGPSGTVVVVGTAHTPCKSEAEVCEVISILQPDAVILELDQERLDLLLEGRGASGYGDEFAAAARAADEAGVPVILGDARIRDIRNQLLRVWKPDAARLLRAARLTAPAWTPATASEAVVRVDVLRAFMDDPAKLKPLTGATVWP